MSSLSKHGTYHVLESIALKKAWCEDGTTHKNYGGGWKRFSKLKPGITHTEAYQRAKNKMEMFLRENPMYARFSERLMELVPSFKKRKMFLDLLTLLPGDPDGVWSEIDGSFGDYFPKDLTLDEIVELDRLSTLCIEEAKKRIQAQKEALTAQ